MAKRIYWRNSSFHIKRENFSPLVKAVCDAFPGRCDMPDALEDVFWNFDFSVETDARGLKGLQFESEYSGDEERFFKAIAPLVEPGSYVEFVNEAGAIWRYCFDGETCERLTPKLLWPAPVKAGSGQKRYGLPFALCGTLPIAASSLEQARVAAQELDTDDLLGAILAQLRDDGPSPYVRTGKMKETEE